MIIIHSQLLFSFTLLYTARQILYHCNEDEKRIKTKCAGVGVEVIKTFFLFHFTFKKSLLNLNKFILVLINLNKKKKGKTNNQII